MFLPVTKYIGKISGLKTHPHFPDYCFIHPSSIICRLLSPPFAFAQSLGIAGDTIAALTSILKDKVNNTDNVAMSSMFSMLQQQQQQMFQMQKDQMQFFMKQTQVWGLTRSFFLNAAEQYATSFFSLNNLEN
jgi:hypothetical protein